MIFRKRFHVVEIKEKYPVILKNGSYVQNPFLEFFFLIEDFDYNWKFISDYNTYVLDLKITEECPIL